MESHFAIHRFLQEPLSPSSDGDFVTHSMYMPIEPTYHGIINQNNFLEIYLKFCFDGLISDEYITECATDCQVRVDENSDAKIGATSIFSTPVSSDSLVATHTNLDGWLSTSSVGLYKDDFTDYIVVQSNNNRVILNVKFMIGLEEHYFTIYLYNREFNSKAERLFFVIGKENDCEIIREYITLSNRQYILSTKRKSVNLGQWALQSFQYAAIRNEAFEIVGYTPSTISYIMGDI